MLKKILEDKKLLSDIILIGILLIVSLSVFFVLFLNRVEGSAVAVYIDNTKVAEYPLSVDATYYLNGGTNVLVIEDGEAYFSYSECPDQTCMEGKSLFGNKISMVGETITCLPNKVMIEIIGEGEGLDI